MGIAQCASTIATPCRCKDWGFLRATGRATVLLVSTKTDTFSAQSARYSWSLTDAAAFPSRHEHEDRRDLARLLRCLTTSLCCASLVAANVLPAAAAELSRAAYEDCQNRDEDGLKLAIATISADALKTGIGKIDYRALVADQWRRAGLDGIIDKRVDIAIEDVKKETSWTERIKSLANAETSQKLATAVAERVYRSDAVTAAIEDLATGVAKEAGKTIEFASADATEPLLACLKAFVGPRYGSAVALAVAGDASKDLAVDPDKGSGSVSAGSVLKETSGGLAGATILVVRRQLATLATRVGQRIVGSVLSRLVSVVAGGVGLVLIAKDIWDFRHGVLPIIASEMKAAATKEKVREEIASTISDQIGSHITDIANASADHVIEIWQGFKRAHALVLKIADGNGAFRTFLDGVKAETLPRMDELVALLVASEGEAGVIRRLDDGSLNQAVHLMPAKGLDIARETKSVASALAWAALAGDKLDTVADYELHKRAVPEDFTRASLERVLSLGDRTSITRLASVTRQARDALFGLETAELASLAKSLSESELSTLASYLNGLQTGPREHVLRTVAANPARMQVLASTRVRDAILTSTDQQAAVEMMLKPSQAFVPREFVHDAGLAWQGRVSPWLLWDKHPAGAALAGLLALMILAWLRRLLFPRHRTQKAAESA